MSSDTWYIHNRAKLIKAEKIFFQRPGHVQKTPRLMNPLLEKLPDFLTCIHAVLTPAVVSADDLIKPYLRFRAIRPRRDSSHIAVQHDLAGLILRIIHRNCINRKFDTLKSEKS